MGYSLLVDVFDVTCMGDTTEHYLYAPYTPPIWDSVAYLPWQARRRFGWRSRGAKRRRNVVRNMDAGTSERA